MDTTRRDWLKVASVSSALIAAGSVPGAALGRTASRQPPSGSAKNNQGDGFYELSLGDTRVAVISDGWFSFNPPHPTLAANATKEQVEGALKEAFFDPADVRVQVNCLLIRTPKDTILVDTGTGGAFGGTNGKLLQNLANVGLKPSDITAVIITHLHGDHMSGLLNADGKPNFPSAEHLVHKLEHDFWAADTHDFSQSKLPKDMLPGFVEGAKKVIKGANFTLVDGEKEVLPGVTVIPSPGHTAGHIAIQVDGGGGGKNVLLYMSDTVHHPAIQFPHPEWAVMFDAVPDQSIASRRKLFDRAAADRTLLSGAHIPFPSVGHLRKQAPAERKGYDWVAAMWEW
jgi:glyoxylase-like metal-dependent hydrolase (beta-lactamase superfamily II)